MTKLPKTTNITQLAAHLNLSKGTVSRILNDPDAPFAAGTKQRVFTLAAETGYQPDPLARALATGRTGAVAFWIRNLTYTYDAWVTRTFEEQAEGQSYELIIRLFGRELEMAARRHDEPLQGPLRPTLPDSVDGIVTHGLPPESWVRSHGRRSRQVPMVVTGSNPGPDAMDFVGFDLAPASRQAVEHLLETGRRNIWFLTPPHHDARYRAYVSVMHEAGLEPRVVDEAEVVRSETRRKFREYLQAHGHPDAVFCQNDDIAIAAYRAIYDVGLCVPDDVALIGCDGIQDTEYLMTPLTTIVHPIEDMCRIAWQYLNRRIQSPDAVPLRTTLQSRLVIRQSSGTDASDKAAWQT